MKEYHKIETLYERDMEGTKKLIEGKFRDPLIEYIKDCQWNFTEKVDGTNVRIHWDGHKVEFGGRTDNAQMPMPLVTVLTEKFMGETNAQLFEQKFGENDVILYGEGYGGKIQGGGYSKDTNFILFDVEIGNSKIQSTFLERENVVEIGKAFGVKTVPIVVFGTLKEGVEYVKQKPLSLIAEDHKEMEGLIGTPAVRMQDNLGHRVIVKLKVRDFLD